MRAAALLEPTGLDDNQIQKTLGSIMGHAVDNADLYFQLSRHESWSLEDGIVRDAQHSIEQGVGVRAMSGEKTGFAYSDELVLPALTRAGRSSACDCPAGWYGRAAGLEGRHPVTASTCPWTPWKRWMTQPRCRLLQEVDASTRAVDPRVKEVMVSLSGVHEVILVAASDGTFNADVRPLVRMNVSVIVEENGRREQGYAGGGGRLGYEHFLEDGRGHEYGREAVRQALVLLEGGGCAGRHHGRSARPGMAGRAAA